MTLPPCAIGSIRFVENFRRLSFSYNYSQLACQYVFQVVRPIFIQYYKSMLFFEDSVMPAIPAGRVPEGSSFNGIHLIRHKMGKSMILCFLFNQFKPIFFFDFLTSHG